MMKIWHIIMVILLMMIPSVYGMVIESNSSLVLDRNLGENVIATADKIYIETPMTGDLLYASGMINVSATVMGDIMGLTGLLTVDEPIEGDIRTAAGNMIIANNITGDVIAFAGTVEVNKGAVLKDDIYVFAGQTTLLGTAEKDVYLYGGIININGTVMGDVYVDGDNVKIGSDALIYGNLTYRTGNQLHVNKNQVRGNIIFNDKDQNVIEDVIMSFILVIVSYLITAYVFLKFTPKLMQHALDIMNQKTGTSLGTGLIGIISIPIIVLFLLLTVVGIPLGLTIVAGLILILYLGNILASIWLGERVFGMFGRSESIYSKATLGIIVLIPLEAIPSIGNLLRLLAMLTGTGAFMLFMHSLYRQKDL